MEEDKQAESADADFPEDLPYEEDNFNMENNEEVILGNTWEEIKDPEHYTPYEWSNMAIDFQEGPSENVIVPTIEPIYFWHLYFSEEMI